MSFISSFVLWEFGEIPDLIILLRHKSTNRIVSVIWSHFGFFIVFFIQKGMAIVSERLSSKTPLQSISMKLMSALAQAQGHRSQGFRREFDSDDDLDLWLTFLIETGMIGSSDPNIDRCKLNHVFISLSDILGRNKLIDVADHVPKQRGTRSAKLCFICLGSLFTLTSHRPKKL